MTLTAQGRRNIIEAFRANLNTGAIRLYEGDRLIVRLPFPELKALAVGSGMPDRFDAVQGKRTVLLDGRVGQELVIDHPYIEAGALVTIKRYEILVDGFTPTGKSN